MAAKKTKAKGKAKPKAKRAPAKKAAATKKKATKSKRGRKPYAAETVDFHFMHDARMKPKVMANAKKYTGGQVAAWLRFASVHCKPTKADQKALEAAVA